VPARLWMTTRQVVWFVCSGWGSAAVVHGRSGGVMSVGSLRTAVSTAGAVTDVVAESKVFRNLGGRSALRALPNASGEFFDVIEDLPPLGHLRQNLLLRVHHGGVVAPERLPDLGQRQVGQFAT
jgi:hypothetical protein